MTVGNITQGVTDGPYYYTKAWSGSDGRYSGQTVKQNAYSMSSTRHQSAKGTKPSGTYITPGHGLYSTIVTWNENDELKLLSKLSETARGHSFNLGVALAESGQTTQLVVHTLSRITSAIGALRRGRVDQALRTLGASPSPEMLRKHQRKFDGQRRRSREFQQTGRMSTSDVSAMWLEVQYGWKPLLQDIHEGMTAFARHTDPPRVSRYSVTKSKTSERISYPLGTTAIKVFTQETVSKTIHVYQRESLSIPRSLGLADPRPIIWEKLPFSFVADWFIPIGSYLDSLATVPFIQATFVVSVKDTVRGQGTGGTDQYGTQNYIGASASGTRVTLNRTIPGAIVVPLPKFRPIDSALSQGHIANGIALLHQMLK